MYVTSSDKNPEKHDSSDFKDYIHSLLNKPTNVTIAVVSLNKKKIKVIIDTGTFLNLVTSETYEEFLYQDFNDGTNNICPYYSN